MSEWKEYKLGELCTDINYGYTASANNIGGGPKFLRITDIVPQRVDWTAVPYCEIDVKNSSKYKLEKGDIVIARTGATTGYNYTFNDDVDAVFASYLIRYRINNRIASPFYIGYLLKSENWKGFVDNIIGGSAQPGANAKMFADFDILLPPLKIQEAVVSILLSLDKKIDLLHRQNNTLEELAETLFRQWFVEEGDDSWTDTSLQAETEVFRGLSYKGSGLAEEGNGLPMHNLNSVYEGGGYKLDGIKFYNGEYRDRHIIKPGEIIVTNTEQGHEHKLIGFPAIVPDYYGDLGLFSQHIYKLKILPESYLSNEYLYYLLMTYSMREQIIGATNGSTVNMLAIDGLQRPEFKLPPKEKVLKYTTIIKDYWNKKNSNNKQIRTITQLRDTLLPKLMRGEIKVN